MACVRNDYCAELQFDLFLRLQFAIVVTRGWFSTSRSELKCTLSFEEEEWKIPLYRSFLRDGLEIATLYKQRD